MWRRGSKDEDRRVHKTRGQKVRLTYSSPTRIIVSTSSSLSNALPTFASKGAEEVGVQALYRGGIRRLEDAATSASGACLAESICCHLAGESRHFDWLGSAQLTNRTGWLDPSSARLHEPQKLQCDAWHVTYSFAFAFTLQRPSRCHLRLYLRLLLIQAIQAHVHLLVARPLQSNMLSHLQSAKCLRVFFPKTASKNSVTVLAFCWDLLTISQSSSSFWV